MSPFYVYTIHASLHSLTCAECKSSQYERNTDKDCKKTKGNSMRKDRTRKEGEEKEKAHKDCEL